MIFQFSAQMQMLSNDIIFLIIICWSYSWLCLQVFPLSEMIEDINDQYCTLRAEEVWFLPCVVEGMAWVFNISSVLLIYEW